MRNLTRSGGYLLKNRYIAGDFEFIKMALDFAFLALLSAFYICATTKRYFGRKLQFSALEMKQRKIILTLTLNFVKLRTIADKNIIGECEGEICFIPINDIFYFINWGCEYGEEAYKTSCQRYYIYSWFICDLADIADIYGVRSTALHCAPTGYVRGHDGARQRCRTVGFCNISDGIHHFGI